MRHVHSIGLKGSFGKQTSVSLSLILLVLLIVEWPPEQHDMWLWSVDSIVNPSSTLLHSNCTPFSLYKQNQNSLALKQMYLELDIYLIPSLQMNTKESTEIRCHMEQVLKTNNQT